MKCKDFIQRADFIHETYQNRFPIFGWNGGQGKHVAKNDVLLHRVQGKVLPGILQSPGGMVKSVKPMGGIRIVPII